MPRSKSSQRWLQRQSKDPYVSRAKQEGFRSRAAFKLLEINEKDRLLKPGMTVVDLGAAPGGWSQVAKQLVGRPGRVVALDILPITSLPEVEIIQGDFGDQEVFEQLLKVVDKDGTLAENTDKGLVDIVISDIAPNLSGVKAVDIPAMMYLAEMVFEFAYKTLKPEGAMLVKVFQGEGFDEYLRTLREYFLKVRSRKPNASRSESKEMYLLATGFKGRSQ